MYSYLLRVSLTLRVLLQGGETAGLARMADHLADKDWVAAFEKPKGNPAAFKKPATTCLSPYLKFGCVSARLFYSQLAAVRFHYNEEGLAPGLCFLICSHESLAQLQR